ncbi:MAG: 30S ribosomal protein S16 [Candidatus Moranbacteria bacterium]|nr:30S ribosomal protein S16 [Candidatus Moranbacteria bacterium]
MLVIRLKRVGKKNKPTYRLVVAEKARAVSGKFVETLGSIDPHAKKRQIKADRALYWLNVGAKPSDTAYNLLVDEKIIEGEKRKVKIKAKKKKKEGEDQEPAKDTKKAEAKSEAAEEVKQEESKEPAQPLESDKAEVKEKEEKKSEEKPEEKPQEKKEAEVKK